MYKDHSDSQEEHKNAQENTCQEVSSSCESVLKEKDGLISTLKSEIEQLQERIRYVSADFETFRRRAEKERHQLFEAGEAAVLKDLIPILDDFDRAFAQIGGHPELATYFSGFELMYKALQKMLVFHHVREIDQLSVFDPELHEAVMHVCEEGYAENAIVKVLQKGYLYKDIVLRPARVAVQGS